LDIFEHAVTVNNRRDRNGLPLNTINNSIAVNETLSQGAVLEFQDDAACKGKPFETSGGADYLCDNC
jgi:hypothetical protein